MSKSQGPRFQEQIAIVTGSGRGIGRAIALKLASEGASIVVNFFRNRGGAEETAAAIQAMGCRATVVRANVGEMAGIDELFDTVRRDYGRLDILVCNAASGFNRPALEQKPRGWDWTMNINARSLLFCAQQAVPLMTGGGSIVSLSSPGATRVLPEYVVVGASKAALEALTRYLGVELAPRGIRVNAVSPGIVETDALKHFQVMQGEDPISRLAALTPAGRLTTPEDVANVVAFLCSTDAAMICGQTIVVDGGFTLPVSGPTS
ncbi:MAG: enoyl-[acyl-carrier-protein] reductase FabL [Anaerolineales bacterium]|nr:enoyl-[acyl-carrier-protein] reductase FabL [Anaerolineales bacterium]